MIMGLAGIICMLFFLLPADREPIGFALNVCDEEMNTWTVTQWILDLSDFDLFGEIATTCMIKIVNSQKSQIIIKSRCSFVEKCEPV